MDEARYASASLSPAESAVGQSPTAPGGAYGIDVAAHLGALTAGGVTIAALARGTVVIEAAERSGTLATARHASDLNRPLMAVPGPVTSSMSAGCNALIRDHRAACVAKADDIMARIPL